MLRLLLDEDIKARSLIRLLNEAHHDVITTADRDLDGRSDDEVLRWATKEDRVVVTYNCDDFRRLHEENIPHAGIIVVYQEPGKSMSYVQIVRAMANLESSGVLVRGSIHALNQWSF